MKSEYMRRRVLLIAEAANPEWASVPLVGWSLAHALMAQHDALLVTHVRNREAILRQGLREGVDFVCIDSEHVARRLSALAVTLGAKGGKGWTISTMFASLAYYEFERLVWKQFAADIRGGRFELVHRITPLSPVAPSLLAKRCRTAGVPFVVGPLNGGVPWPKQFLDAQRREREWLAKFRGLSRFLPGYRSMRKHAAAIIFGSRDSIQLEPEYVRNTCFYLPENAVDPARFNRTSLMTPTGPLRLCFVGRLVPYKGCDMLLEAVAPFLTSGQIELDIVGDGPMKPELLAQYGHLKGLSFHGWVAHSSVQDILCRAHILSFPSIREFGGGVVLEAMALGVVPVVIDYAGPGELVSDRVGYKVALNVRNELIRNMGELFGRLVLNSARAEIAQKSSEARCRVAEKFTWSAKASQISALYEAVCCGRVGIAARNLVDGV